MAIKITLAPNSSFSVSHLFGIMDYLSTDAQIGGVTSTSISGTGSFIGLPISFQMSGTGFTPGLIGGEQYIVAGTLNKIVFDAGPSGSVVFDAVDIDLSVFSPIIASDISGASILAIEHFLMDLPWDVSLGNQNDIATKGMLVIDGADLNLKGADIIRGMGGNDQLFSGDGDDRLFGNTGRDILNGGNGNDVVKGGKGYDRIFGSNGRDKLFGDAGNDKLKGGGGNDILVGGEGNDILTGGAGFDRFVFKDGHGRDKITDFNAFRNKEDIDLKAVSEITGFVDLKNNHMSQVDLNVVIDDGAGTEIVLIGVNIADLHRGDFIF